MERSKPRRWQRLATVSTMASWLPGHQQDHQHPVAQGEAHDPVRPWSHAVALGPRVSASPPETTTDG
jgi:hypothetical protein